MIPSHISKPTKPYCSRLLFQNLLKNSSLATEIITAGSIQKKKLPARIHSRMNRTGSQPLRLLDDLSIVVENGS